MNTKQIIDKIVQEADVQPNEYPVADRLLDVNQVILEYIEIANQLGSKEPISAGEVYQETFTVAEGFNEFARTIKDVAIFRVDFQSGASGRYCRLSEDINRNENNWCGCEIDFYADEKRIFVENGRVGTLRVTYVRGDIAPLTQEDYDNEVVPTWIPAIFHDLLWLEPTLRQAEFYKPDRVAGLRRQRDEKKALFISRYRRNAKLKANIRTPESRTNPR